ncbi:AMP-dependent synthetase [Saccharobesus litoralis]|uniref:AMP-dependent synthetase n=1 Tax=Saccharobesus litoralis TaxID=2172099 RepID=A0A2S0VNA4_9ALTE|nr:class I adenylate-forming enzyme family protein [Saccharobesus litoralis]AWB65704.1 AMP-dependent synthetase [Saccharobesus litoralis]
MSWMLARLQQFADKTAFINHQQQVTYSELLEQIATWKNRLDEQNIEQGHVVAVIADYSPDSAALIIALLMRSAIVVPLTTETQAKHKRFFELANVQTCFTATPMTDGCINWQLTLVTPTHNHQLIGELQHSQEAGLVLFTSGTSGESKGAVLSATRILTRFENMAVNPDKALRCLVFLKLDHIGGLNTLFSILFSGGTAVSTYDRSAAEVCEVIERYQVQLLPTTPTFLNMLLLSGLHQQYDLSSLKVITYGTEPMPMSTLKSVCKVFPEVRLKQTYGLTELGIFSTKSKSNDSDWVKIGGEGVATKVENHILFIKTQTAMLGYLNAPSPFTADGWYNTGDRVEVDGDYYRILGRESEIINVGGEKVYPAEVESVLLEMPNVKEVLVQGKANPVTGNIVLATFVLEQPEERKALYQRVVAHCQDQLEVFKVPKLVMISQNSFMSDRLKKSRKQTTKTTEA